MLLPSYFRYWGKARPSDSSQPDAHLLAYHCLDVAAVATEYLARAHTLRALLRAGFGFGSDEQLQTWTCTWVALHDVGKFSEAFQAQRPDIFKQLRNRAPDARHANARTRHDTLGMLHWQEVLWKSAEVQNWFGPRTHDLLDGVDAWVRSVTGHHGQPPSEGAGFHGNYFHRDDSVAIDEFAHGVRKLFGSTALQLVDEQQIDEFNAASARTSWWLAGMTVLADWIGSNTDYFPYRSGAEPLLPLAEYWPRAREQARVALSKCGVLPSAIPTGISASMLFPGIATLTPLQTWAANVELASEPQIHLLEDVTGAGKTEAAVILAYRIMAAGLADGFFTALPTMATANAMYARVANVYQQLFAGNADLVLAHGSRNFVEEFARTVVASGNVVPDHNQQDETATARCAAWLADSNKRSLLATAGVGTIDQVLLAVLKSKHQSLRVLGLVGKVLIVDEVHACDDYLPRVLQNDLELHARKRRCSDPTVFTLHVGFTSPVPSRQWSTRAYQPNG